MAILSNGESVGIGTTTPTSSAEVCLQIKGASHAALVISEGNQDWQFLADLNDLSIYEESNHRGSFKSGGNFYWAGNFGVGATSPGAKFHVNGGGGIIEYSESSTTITSGYGNDDMLQIRNSNNTTNNWAILSFGNADNAVAVVGAQITDQTNDLGDIAFLTRTTTGFPERMRITNAGEVGIGTPSPESGSALTVVGSGVIKPKFKSSNNSCLINIESTSASGQAGIQLLNSGSQKWEFRNTADDSHKLLFFDASSNNVLSLEQGGNISMLTSTSGAVFKVGIKSTSGDPTGVEGGLYYNSSTKLLRFYANTAWRTLLDCN